MVLMTSLFAASGASAGGGSSAPSGEASLVGRQWHLVMYRNNQGVLSPVVAGTKVTALFDEAGKVSGSAGCNQYFAGYSLEGKGIVFGPVGATFKYCAEPAGVMDQEQAYVAALGEAATYSVTGAHLELRAAKGTPLATFIADPTGTKLVGPVWTWQKFLGADGRVTVPHVPAHYTVAFLANGAVEIRADCNNAFGQYRAGPGHQLRIAVQGSTAVACPPGSLGDEFLLKLGHAADYLLKGGMLYISLQADAGSMVFTPVTR
jgi:heat shock protein HslJ